MQCCGSMCFRLWCVYWMPCSVRLHGTQYTHHMLSQHCITY